MSYTKIIAERFDEVRISDYWKPGDRHVLKAHSKLVHLDGNEKPYFSVTAELRNTRKRGDNAIECCGTMHDDIVKHFPVLEPIIKIHLADDRGVPMYAVENGAYWLGFTQWKETAIRGETITLPHFPFFCSLWRVDRDEARRIYDACRSSSDPRAHLEWESVAKCHQWQAEADIALAVIKAGTS